MLWHQGHSAKPETGSELVICGTFQAGSWLLLIASSMYTARADVCRRWRKHRLKLNLTYNCNRDKPVMDCEGELNGCKHTNPP